MPFAVQEPSLGDIICRASPAIFDKASPASESVGTSEFLFFESTFSLAHQALRRISFLPDGWDSYGAERPNEAALFRARSILEALRKARLAPTRVVPSADGGVGICFVESDKYADIECFNTGETLAAWYRDHEEPTVWEVPEEDAAVEEAIRRIREHLAT